ncbi:MAG: flagellar basal body rod protein FlgB [Verrucomicrobia bacterium]|nr:flagellar basal body rod protein FlgB [Verrucomicrobiota bacterium]
MIDALFSQANYSAVKKMLDATALRHEAIASNLANLETPHYRRVDVNPSFTAELRQAMETRDSAQIGALQPTLAVDANAIARGRDGNTVQLESELVKLNQNTLAHTLETQLVTGQLLRLRLAITGRPA